MTRPKIESPCIKVCAVDGQTGLCLGCGRSLKEIGGWMQFDDAGRRQQTEEDTDTDPLAAKASRLTNGSLHRNPSSDSRLKSPNKKKSALTVSCSLMIHCSLL